MLNDDVVKDVILLAWKGTYPLYSLSGTTQHRTEWQHLTHIFADRVVASHSRGVHQTRPKPV